MPHIIVEYSSNLEDCLAIDQLLRSIHEAALTHPTIPSAGLRTRAERRENYVIADGNSRHIFIAVLVRMNGDRGDGPMIEVRDLVMDACRGALKDLQTETPIALSVEVQGINSKFRINENGVRSYMEKL
jgi:5-carboxymethyl-2-hydroxymuconate isomerase